MYNHVAACEVLAEMFEFKLIALTVVEVFISYLKKKFKKIGFARSPS